MENLIVEDICRKLKWYEKAIAKIFKKTITKVYKMGITFGFNYK